MEWVAAGNSTQPAPRSPATPILFHGLNEVPTAAGMKAALPTDDRTERELITANNGNQSARHKVIQQPQTPHHGCESEVFAAPGMFGDCGLFGDSGLFGTVSRNRRSSFLANLRMESW